MFRTDAPHARATETQQEEAEESDGSLDQQENRVPVFTHEDLANFETVKRALDVLKEGEMDVAGFLDALCWGNQLVIADPTMRSARTSLTRSDRLTGIVSRWLHPPRTSQGGSVAEGAKQLLPVKINDRPQRPVLSADNKIECCEIRSTTFHEPDEWDYIAPVVP